MPEEPIGFVTTETFQSHPYLALGLGAAFVAGLGVDIWMLARIPVLRAALAARASAMRRTFWSWREAFILCLAAFMLNQMALLTIRAVEWLSGSTAASMPMALLLQTAWVPLCILMLVRTILLRHGASWGDAFGAGMHRFTHDVARAIPLLLGLLPPLALAAGIAQLILTRLDIPFDRQFVVNMLTDPGQPAWLRAHLCAAAILVAPVVEEIAFRGILLPAFARGGRCSMAVAASALLFAGAHFNLASVLPLFVLAAGLSLAYIATGSIGIPIAMHALFNALSLSLLLLDP